MIIENFQTLYNFASANWKSVGLFFSSGIIALILRLMLNTWTTSNRDGAVHKKQTSPKISKTNGNDSVKHSSLQTNFYKFHKNVQESVTSPISVNYHFTRQCNYECGFCFHTAKTSDVLPLYEAKRGLKMLKEAGMQKVNFSGGEPFIVQRGKFVGELVTYCKTQLCLPSVTIVSNGSLVKERWFEKYGRHLDILAVSCDSFVPEVNKQIGRQQGQKDHLKSLKIVRDLCNKYKVAFKLNTVVNTYNKDEDMVDNILELSPCRWKVFQCLLIAGENVGDEAIRNAESFVISNEEFEAFLARHKQVTCLVPESNEKMQNSYLILDEYMRFLDCTGGDKKPSKSLLDVGVSEALKFSGFDEVMFRKRGGKYVWSKADMKLDW